MYNTNSHEYTMPNQQQKKHQQHVKQTTARTDGNPMAEQAMAEQAGSQNTPQCRRLWDF